MTAVVAMSTALRVCARLQVAHSNFVLFFLAHIAFLNCFWVVSVAPNIFSLRATHSEDMITSRAKTFAAEVLTP